MQIIFKVVDKTGREIRLPKKQWTHIIKKRPDMASYLEEIKETLRNPLRTRVHNQDINVKYYFRYLKHKRLPNKYLLVAVKYLNITGFIITAYFVGHVKWN